MNMDLSNSEKLPAYGLGLFMLVAGVSKFLILQYWIGYEPQILLQLLPLKAKEVVLLGGLFETFLGLMLIARKRVEAVSFIITLWLSTITLQLVRMEIWDLVIRDLGLVLYSFTVYKLEKRSVN